MNFQQLRYIREVVRRGLSVSEAADALCTAQPGVSKQIRMLEDELGIKIFVRSGKRLVAITQPGMAVIEKAERILRESDNLKQIGEEFRNETSGTLVIAATHTQARYTLPKIIPEFLERYPNVRLSLRQGTPTQIAEAVISGEADVGIATESLDQFDSLAVLACHQWNRSIVTLPGHPLAKLPQLTLEAIADFPIITYDSAFTGRTEINRSFYDKGLSPNIILTAIDADIIKTYVRLGLGIGILASMAYEPQRDVPLVALDAQHLFNPSTTKIAVHTNSYLRGYTYTLIEMFAPHLTRKVVDQVLQVRQ